ncbi:MAG: lecithin retinol acyltransferase family protein [Spirochaetaceae bacterium]|nr:lecithin retinol acyltransferase family protein [Spirochaetaceae bacterium]
MHRLLVRETFAGVLNLGRPLNGSPKIGSVVYCGLAVRGVNHSGVYIGGGKIVELAGNGIVREVGPSQFVRRGRTWAMLALRAGALAVASPLSAFTGAVMAGTSPLDSLNIRVSCKGDTAVGDREVACRAKRAVGDERKYDVIDHNCHFFTCQCLTGEEPAHPALLWNVMETAQRILGADDWWIWRF